MSRSNQLAGLITATPTSTLDTINEINTSLNNDNDLSGTLTGLINAKASKSGDTFTGDVTFSSASGQFKAKTTGDHFPGLIFDRQGTSVGAVVYDTAQDALEIYTDDFSGQPQVTVDNAGNVGVGTTASFGGSATRKYLSILNTDGTDSVDRPAVIELASSNKGDGVRVGEITAISDVDGGDDEIVSFVFAQDGTTTNNVGGKIRIQTKADGGSLADRMIIDQVGKVGIGTTSPQALINILPGNAVEGVRVSGSSNTLGLTLAYTDAGYTHSYIYNKYSGNDDSDIIFGFGSSYGSGTVMTLKKSGNVSILSDSASYSPTLEIKNTNAGAYGGRLKFVAKHNSTEYTPAEIRGYGSTGASDGVLAFETAGTERMRINGVGSIRKNFAGSYAEGVAFGPSTESGYTTNYSLAVASNDYLIRFADASWNLHGQIRCNGDGIALSSASDYRVKENVTPLENALERINKLSPKRFTWKNYPDLGEVDGFIAHEVTEAVPEAVDGEKDRLRDNGDIWPQGLDMTKLVPLLTASIQELSAKVTALESAS